MPENLWGEMPEPVGTTPPSKVLKEQASVLTINTKGVLQGEVREGDRAGKAICDLYVISPNLGGFEYQICRAEFSRVQLYPCRLFDWMQKRGFNCEDEDKFKKHLKEVLQSDHTRQVIASLMRQSE